ncbi:expressed unknown protein [Seminavis robusta]|uniref:Uncharacterized protein n=1 Tax=Seminavis robusta TaxID=568900 RepID=A0A9N8HKH2_9STRA|nr:expressed unknown protein [Seminavis robusta]|eukprot:Sro757_g197860.1 n/a (350) ;mRNA; f:452-1594
MELEKAFSKDVTEYTMDEEDDDDDDDDLVDDDEVDLFDEELNHGCGVTTTPNGTTVVSCNPAAAGCGNPALPTTNEDVSRQLLEAFNCGDDFTEFSGSAVHHAKQRSCRLVDAFYDNTCGNYRDAVHMKRPYYDERFAQRFIKDIMEEGLNVLWHLPPSDEDSTLDSANWSGRSVVMTVKAGSSYSTNSNDVMPKLCWTTLGGGKDESKLARCLVPLLKIQSVSTFRDAPPVVGSLGDEIKEEELTGTSCGVNLKPVTVDEEDVCLFAITTEEGDVQVFEAASSRERDVFVTGLKNVIARLSFHVIVGDAGASSELYYQHDKQSPEGQLPSIPSSPAQNMNRIAHALLD